MARDVFQMTISKADLTGVPTDRDLVALEGIQVSVFDRGTTNLVQPNIFQRPTGLTPGPTPECGATGGPNPFNTGPTGGIEFWVDGPKEVDVFIHDTVGPARIVDRTFGWNAMPVAAASVPSSLIAADAGLSLAALGADLKRQLVQIGQVIDWWRPNATVPIPAGFVICDGRQVPAGQHDFLGVAGAINVPDLRNAFIIGALPSSAGESSDGTTFKVHGSGAGQGDPATNAPGIAGTGGSNAAKNFAHGHGVPGLDHAHNFNGAAHSHDGSSLYTGGHSHGVGTSESPTYAGPYNLSIAGTTYFANIHHAHSGWTDSAGNIGVGGSTGGASAVASTTAGSGVLNTATNSTTWTADPGSDIRPKFIGLLKLMKVRYS